MRILFALCLIVAAVPGAARASLCYAFVEELRRDHPGVRYAQLGPQLGGTASARARCASPMSRIRPSGSRPSRAW